MLPVAESSSTPAGRGASRKRYARIPEVLPIPNLIELQRESFQWFVEKGLRELFDEISPIKDFTGKVMELQFAVAERTGERPSLVSLDPTSRSPGMATASVIRSTPRRSAGRRT
jgi:DNA-directed RNA polymerase beta subunit